MYTLIIDSFLISDYLLAVDTEERRMIIMFFYVFVCLLADVNTGF